MRRPLVPIVLTLTCFLGCAAPATNGVAFTSGDSAAVRATQEAYVAAWLADDSAAVMRTLASGAVLMPPRMQPLTGDSAIRGYWWPTDGSTTRITSFTWEVNEVQGGGGMAYTRGLSTLTWTYEKDTVRQTSTTRSPNLTVLRRESDGTWRITHQMWGPPLP